MNNGSIRNKSEKSSGNKSKRKVIARSIKVFTAICVFLLTLRAYTMSVQFVYIPETETSTENTSYTPEPVSVLVTDQEPPLQLEPPRPEPTTPKPDMPSSFRMYDTVIRNGRIINPETNSDITGMNIGIIDGKISAVTFEELSGELEFDATGLVVAPGFIDILSFDPNFFGEQFKISDGVTTTLLMHGGTGDAAQWFDGWHGRNSYMINYGTSNLVENIRGRMGYGARNVMTNPNSLQRLVDAVEANLYNGALGISMSPEYSYGIQGAELLALSELAARHNMATYYHLRYSCPEYSLDGIQEVIDLARETGVSTHIMHISSTGATHVAVEAFQMIDEARAEGLDISACIYPYDSWATYAGSARFDAGWQERFRLTYSDLQFPNSTGRLDAETFARARRENSLIVANGSIPEHEVRYALTIPYVFVASDTILYQYGEDSHPRGAGTFSRTIGKYARDEGVITLMEAISMITYMPAKRIESASYDIRAKGRIEVGADADITIFDFNTIIDTSTVEYVASHSEGIKYVFVAGQLVYDNTEGDNRFTGLRPGGPVFSRLRSPDTRPQPVLQTVDIVGHTYEINAMPLFDRYFVDIREISRVAGSEYEIHEDGRVEMLGATLYIGRPDLITGSRHEWLSHEAIIYRGSAYISVEDLRLFE